MTFGAFLRDPATGPRLDQMLKDNARVDAELALAEHRCADDAIVDVCDGKLDLYRCLTCDRTWEGICPDAALWRPED